MTGTVDPELMAKLLLLTEQVLDHGGWNKPGAIFELFNHELAYFEEADGVELMLPVGDYASQYWYPPDLLSGTPTHDLFRLSLNFGVLADQKPNIRTSIEKLRRHAFLGAAFANENWHRQAGTPEENEAARRKGLTAEDFPDSVETRWLTAVDTQGRVYTVVRDRGKDPFIGWTPLKGEKSPGPPHNRGGAIVQSLSMISGAVAGWEELPEVRYVPAGWDWKEQQQI